MRPMPSRGVTLIDTLVGTALMLVIFIGIAGAFQLSVEVVTSNKARAGAIALANERMEYIRSLSYAQIGTQGGIPSGTLAQSESVSLNGVSYTRRTYVQYVDNAADGVAPADTIPVDYKLAKVDVSWVARTGDRHIIVASNIASDTGLEITCSPCGTLFISAVNASGAGVSNAAVTLVNASTSVNLTTYTNASGTAMLIGAPIGSGYQVTVTKTGYSTARTYSASAQNTSPDPSHLTVANAQTTSGTFAIDQTGEKTITTLSQVVSDAWSDSFADADEIATSTNIDINGGAVALEEPAPYPSSGFVLSSALAPSNLVAWKTIDADYTAPANTNIRFRLYDAGSNLLPDSALSGNSAGFTSLPIDVSGVSTTTYPSLRIGASFTSAGDATPELDSWEIAYSHGGVPIPNVSFSMRGAKTIGSGPSGLVYKYDETHSSGAQGTKAVSGLEWDTYTVSVPAASGYDIASSCAPQPETLTPGETESTRLYLAAHTAHSLLVEVRSSTGVLLTNANVRLTRTGYDTTIATDGCGQAFFPGLTANTYTLSVTASGYTPYSNSSLTVSGTTAFEASLE